jgi:hypothetical protein
VNFVLFFLFYLLILFIITAMRTTIQKSFSLTILSFFLLSVTCVAQGHGDLGKDGTIIGGRVKFRCSKPSKRYTKTVNVAVKGAFDTWKEVSNLDLSASVKTEVAKLTDYSQEGLDLDLILFRVCEISNNRGLNAEQINDLIMTSTSTWNNKMSIKEQKNIIAQLRTELASNLKTANELKLNTETILSSLSSISGEGILRNPGIKILPLLFPISNLNEKPQPVSELVEYGLFQYQSKGLDTNSLEKQKFTSAGKIVALTIDKTIPIFNSLSDREGTRYPVYTTIWNSNATNLSKINVFDITKFQTTYSDLNSLKNNYNIIVLRSIDYLTDLNKFFKPGNNVITREDIEKILTSERLAFDLIVTYSNSLIKDIESLTALQNIVDEALK